MSDLFAKLLCTMVASLMFQQPVRADTGEPPRLQMGAGTFTLRVGPNESRDVAVYYYRPRNLTDQSPVLIVLPGAGRNAWDYREHWIDASEQFGVLVLSLHYPESSYPRFWNYNLAGMISDVVIDPSAKVMDYRVVMDRQQWLFDDIDRIFESVVRATGLKTKRYDLFGHSAGGQFLHRFALFADDDAKADRILASNSGWYTVPDSGERFPYGLAEAPITEQQLAVAFARHLVVFLGGTDDENETRGDLVRSAQTDRQGPHRLARGKYFHAQAIKTAARMNTGFNWTLVVEPGVGHDPKRMASAAARYLYGQLTGNSLPGAGEALREVGR